MTLHTYEEAVENIYAGGAAHRAGIVGTFYLGEFGNFAVQYSTYSTELRSYGGNIGGFGAAISADETFQRIWILIPPDEWKETLRKQEEYYKEFAERQRAAEKAAGIEYSIPTADECRASHNESMRPETTETWLDRIKRWL